MSSKHKRNSKSNEFYYEEVIPSKPTRLGTDNKSSKSFLSRMFAPKRSRTLSKHDLGVTHGRSEADVLNKLKVINAASQSSSVSLQQTQSLHISQSSSTDIDNNPSSPLLSQLKVSLTYGSQDALETAPKEAFIEAINQARAAIVDGRIIFENDANTNSAILFSTLLESAGDILKGSAKYQEAADYLSEAVRARKRYNCPKVDTAYVLNDLGLIQCELGQYAEAKNSFKESFDILSEIHGDAHPDIAASLGNLGVALRGTKEFTASLTAHEKANKMMERICGKDHEFTLQQKALLGISLTYAGDAQQGKRVLRLLLTQLQQLQVYAENHPWLLYVQSEYDIANSIATSA
jgi:tetratricopeptide (TPR) repeat protein